jgi:CelD/BcsL family acetyltransferase involved in cellulose biosynthesis
MSELKVVLYDDAEQVRALEADWEKLVASVPTYSACQEFDFAMCGWDTLPKGPDVRLAVVTVWRGGELICVWPFFIRRKGGLTVACHLGSGDLHEYAGPLVRDDDDTEAVVRAALAVIKGLADVVKVYNVRGDSRIVPAIASDPTPKHNITAPAPVVSVAGASDWETWSKTMSKKLRAELRHDRRHLAEKGKLEFRLMIGPEDGVRCMQWIFEQKRQWLVANKIHHSFFLDPQVEVFFMRLAARPARADGRPHGVETYAVTLDDKIIAACICLRSGDRMEFHTTTFDPAYGAWSPGGLMIQDCVMLCMERGVDFDFRMGQQPYKARWSDRLDNFESFSLACTLRGRLAVSVEAAQSAVHAMRVKYGPRVKALLRRRRVLG